MVAPDPCREWAWPRHQVGVVTAVGGGVYHRPRPPATPPGWGEAGAWPQEKGGRKWAGPAVHLAPPTPAATAIMAAVTAAALLALLGGPGGGN